MFPAILTPETPHVVATQVWIMVTTISTCAYDYNHVFKLLKIIQVLET